jgi:adenylate cyclase
VRSVNSFIYFWAELKRRNVFRAGLAWLAMGWLSIEIAARLFPTLGFPEAAIRWLIIGSGIAVLPVMVFTWLFQLTPDGLRRDRGPQSETPENARSGRRTDQLIIVLLLLALASSAVSRFVMPHRAAPVPQVAAPVERGPLRPMAPAGPVDPRSVAVLPFDSLNPGGGDDWFALGMAEELLNVLARVEGLRVSSRTSSFAFHDSTLGTREIARRLGVAHVVDGAVHRVGDRILINAQLTEAASDTVLWTARYEREFSDVFTLQEKIAQAVADALVESLGVRQVRVQAPTADLQAYELYLRGRQLFAQRGSALAGARRLLSEAVERDPEFAGAWATLAGAWYVSPAYSQEIDARKALEMAEQSADRALALDANEATALAVQARLAAERGARLEAASLIQRALALAPNDANTWVWQGLGQLEAGHIAAARESYERARELDPLSGLIVGWYGVTTALQGDVQAGTELLREAHGLGWVGPARFSLLKLALADGPSDEASRRFQDWVREDPRVSDALRPMHLVAEPAFRSPGARDQALQALHESAAIAPNYSWAGVLLMLGAHEAALEEALSDKDQSGWIFLLNLWHPQDRGFREQPGFMRLADQSGLAEFWRVNGAPDHCRLLEAPVRRLECQR